MSTKTLNEVNLFEIVKGRRSVRKYDPSFQMTKDEVEELIQEAMLAPSAGNLQPTRYFVIHDIESKNQLYPIANNQAQVTTASVVIAILGDLEGHKNAEEIYGKAAELGYMTYATKE